MTYVEEVRELAEKIKGAVGIDIFEKAAKGRTPTGVGGEFITNKEQGDWAEQLLLKIINQNPDRIKAVSYGREENLVAGDAGFKELFEDYKAELASLGKCPDLLIFNISELTKEIEVELTSHKARSELKDTVKKAIAGIEVRSSAFNTKDYMKYRVTKKTSKRAFLSFTPKVEDLAGILRWVENHGIPHFYAQVFFDSIHIISFKKILELLSEPSNKGTKYFIENNSKNGFKSTIHIDLNEGFCLSNDVKMPEHISVRKVLANGRLVHYVSFKYNELPKDFNLQKLIELLEL